MGRLIDEADAVAKINEHLRGHEFHPRDADGNDFQYGEDSGLRFKTGTVYGEVSVQVVKQGHTAEVIRVLRSERVDDAKHQIDNIIARHIGIER